MQGTGSDPSILLAASSVFITDTEFCCPSILSAVNCLQNSKPLVGNSGKLSRKKRNWFHFPAQLISEM